jgi:hypothetical protein
MINSPTFKIVSCNRHDCVHFSPGPTIYRGSCKHILAIDANIKEISKEDCNYYSQVVSYKPTQKEKEHSHDKFMKYLHEKLIEARYSLFEKINTEEIFPTIDKPFNETSVSRKNVIDQFNDHPLQQLDKIIEFLGAKP